LEPDYQQLRTRLDRSGQGPEPDDSDEFVKDSVISEGLAAAWLAAAYSLWKDDSN